MSHYKKANQQRQVANKAIVPTLTKVSDRLNVVQCIRNYILKMISNVKGVKVLLLDDYTKEVISLVMSQTEIMKHEVFLVGMLQDKKRQKLPNLRCIIFVRPSEAINRAIRDELNDPKYQAYSLYFTNVLPTEQLDKIASQDKQEMVKHVYEYFADYIALDRILFTLNIPTMVPMLNSSWGEPSFNRLSDALLAVLLSVKKARPFIRYQKNSDLCRNIAEAVNERIDEQKDLFKIPQSEAHRSSTPLLLLLDRREDPITPLLTQWTYQAMLHELCTIKNNRIVIDLSEKKDNEESSDEDDDVLDDEDLEAAAAKKKRRDAKAKKDAEKKKEVVVNAELDSFYAENWSSNWGDLCESVKDVIEKFKENNQVKDKITSINDIQQFMRDYPQFKKFAGEVDKHASLVQECRKQISKRHLMDVSELEQSIACTNSHSEHIQKLKQLLNDSRITPNDALRLVLIYAFKYDNTKGELPALKKLLASQKNYHASKLIDNALKFSPRDIRTEETTAPTKTSFSFTGLAKKAMSAFHDDEEVQNVFTQHKPRLHTILDALFKNALNDNAYPYFGLTSRDTARDVIVFIVGGATYEEALTVHKFNINEEDLAPTNTGSSSSSSNRRERSVVLGGTTILNSKSFLKELLKYSDHSQMHANLE